MHICEKLYNTHKDNIIFISYNKEMDCCCKKSSIWKYIKRFRCMCFTKPLSKQTDPKTVVKKDLEPNIVPIEIIETLSDVSYPSPKKSTPQNIKKKSNSENNCNINTEEERTKKVIYKSDDNNKTNIEKQGMQLHSGQIVPTKPSIKVRELSNFVDKDYLRNSKDWENNSSLNLPLNATKKVSYKTDPNEQIVNEIDKEYDIHKLSNKASLSDSDESYSDESYSECVEPPLN